ncbi:hypothetical protein KAU45_07920 [bacterium]|nr:hypothetical protein [bacterium]
MRGPWVTLYLFITCALALGAVLYPNTPEGNVLQCPLYDDQTYDYDLLVFGMCSVEVFSWKVADDFHTDGEWVIDRVKAWAAYNGPLPAGILVEFYAYEGGGPGTLLHVTDVDAEDTTWTWTGDTF